MKYFALICIAGCWQQTIYVGPRIDSSGGVGIELGATFGGAVPNGNGAATFSVDSSRTFARSAACPPSGCAVAQGSVNDAPDAPRGAIRGVAEWVSWPRASDVGFVPLHGIGWRTGGYLGVEAREHSFVPLFGATTTISPWVWGYDGRGSMQFIAFGFQLGAEATPTDGRYAVRAALACDLRYFPKRW